MKRFLELTPINWLLGGEPFVKYRTLIDLLGREREDKEVVATEKLVYKYKLVKRIFDKQNKDGYWGTPKDIYTWWPKKDTTFWLLSLLAEQIGLMPHPRFLTGFTRNDPRIGAMTDLLISKQDKNGYFYAESIHKVWSDFDFGQKELPSRWITLVVYRIVKRVAENVSRYPDSK